MDSAGVGAMPLGDIADREFKKKLRTARHSNAWTIKRERADEYLAKARAAAIHSKNLDIQPYKTQYENARLAEVNALNAELSGTRGQLANILSDSLKTEPGIDISNLRASIEVTQSPPPWLTDRIPGPEWRNYDPGQFPRWLLLVPGMRRWQERRNEGAYRRMEAALTEWTAAEDDRKQRLAAAQATIETALAAEEAKVAADNAQLEEFRRALAAGDRAAVEEYFDAVLGGLVWPDGFPDRHSVAYQPNRTHLDVELFLPDESIIPTVRSYAYDTETDKITPTAEPHLAISELHQSVVAQTTLRVLRELFGADEFNLIRTITFGGKTVSVDDATGKAVEPYLVNTTVDICDFGAVELARVDPIACLQYVAS